jgi:hypothetical protein
VIEFLTPTGFAAVTLALPGHNDDRAPLLFRVKAALR